MQIGALLSLVDVPHLSIMCDVRSINFFLYLSININLQPALGTSDVESVRQIVEITQVESSKMT